MKDTAILLFIMLMMKMNIDDIAIIPEASPSMPSIKLMAFMKTTIQIIVSGYAINPKSIEKTVRKVKRLINNPDMEATAAIKI